MMDEVFSKKLLKSLHFPLIDFAEILKLICTHQAYTSDLMEGREEVIKDCIKFSCEVFNLITEQTSTRFIDTLLHLTFEFMKNRIQKNERLTEQFMNSHSEEVEDVFFCFHFHNDSRRPCVSSEWLKQKLQEFMSNFVMDIRASDLLKKKVEQFLQETSLSDVLKMYRTEDEKGFKEYLSTKSSQQAPVKLMFQFFSKLSLEPGDEEQPCKWIFRKFDDRSKHSTSNGRSKSSKKRKSVVVTVGDSDDEDTIDIDEE